MLFPLSLSERMWYTENLIDMHSGCKNPSGNTLPDLFIRAVPNNCIDVHVVDMLFHPMRVVFLKDLHI